MGKKERKKCSTEPQICSELFKFLLVDINNHAVSSPTVGNEMIVAALMEIQRRA